MICNVCGNQMPDGTKFCNACGAAQITAPQQPQQPAQPQNFQQAQPTQPAQPQNFQQQPAQPAQPTQAPQQPYQAQPTPQPSYNQSGNAYGAQTPPPEKSKTPIIIAAIIGAVLIVAIIAGTIIFLNKDKGGTGDGTRAVADDDDDDKDDEDDDATASTSDASNDTTTEATTEEETTEEVVVALPYAEENALKMVGPSDVDYSGSGALLFENEDGEYEDFDCVSLNSITYTESLNRIYKTEPDDNGIVTYFCEIDLIIEADFDDTDPGISWTVYPSAWGPNFFDYYTGEVLETAAVTSGLVDEGDEEIVSTVTMEDGTSYEIKTAMLYDKNTENYKWDNTKLNDRTNYYYYSDMRYIYIAKVPQEYDGLALGFVTGDVNKDQMVDSLETEFEPRKFLDETNYGSQNTVDDTLCVKISDYAGTNKSDFTSMMSTEYIGTPEASFDWIDDYDHETNAYIGGGTFISDISLLDGNWNCYMLWDKDNKFDCYAEEFLNVNITSKSDGLDFTFDYNVQRWDSDGDWLDKSDVADDYYAGSLNEDGSITLTHDPYDCNFYLDGFYTDGYVQYATGYIMLQSGEGADVFLYRP